MSIVPQDSLQTSLQKLTKLTELQTKALSDHGIHSALDALLLTPLSYEDRRTITPIEDLNEGHSAQFYAHIVHGYYDNKRRMMRLLLSDGTGELWVYLFHCYYSLSQKLTAGKSILGYGRIGMMGHKRSCMHPKWNLSEDDKPNIQGSINPVYPKIGIPQKKIQSIIHASLEHIEKNPPPSIVPDGNLPSLPEAFRAIHHNPKPESLSALQDRTHEAYRRLGAEEFAAHNFSIRFSQAQEKTRRAGALSLSKKLESSLRALLPFSPTKGQEDILDAIKKNLSQTHPSFHLIQGEVGSGKTLLSQLAALSALESGHQAAILAPTSILASQHYQSFRALFETLGFEVYLLLSKTKAKEKRAIKLRIQTQNPCVVIGTHALFEDDVRFAHLGLVCFDEQQRFGVQQRLSFLGRHSGETSPHQMMLSATPIPRSMAMALYGKTGYAALKELPKDRLPIHTLLFSEAHEEKIIASLSRFCQDGQRAYWVCPRIEEDEESPLSALKSRFEMLQTKLSKLRIFCLHGKMKEEEKQKILLDFKAGMADVLVCTTVIEVGIDNPDANLMVIENSEQFGLSQLHQLRGRVGRGAKQGYCFLMHKKNLSEKSQKRLQSFKTAKDGFEIARLDLAQRGAGEAFGERQSGEANSCIFHALNPSLLHEDCMPLIEALQHDTKAQHALVHRWFGKKLAYIQA